MPSVTDHQGYAVPPRPVDPGVDHEVLELLCAPPCPAAETGPRAGASAYPESSPFVASGRDRRGNGVCTGIPTSGLRQASATTRQAPTGSLARHLPALPRPRQPRQRARVESRPAPGCAVSIANGEDQPARQVYRSSSRSSKQVQHLGNVAELEIGQAVRDARPTTRRSRCAPTARVGVVRTRSCRSACDVAMNSSSTTAAHAASIDPLDVVEISPRTLRQPQGGHP